VPSLRPPRVVSRSWLPPLLLLAAAGFWQGGRLAAERVSGPVGQGPLWISESPLDEGRRLLVVVDQASRHLAVYHVETAAGTVTLKSTRDVSWDLMVGDFNAQEPRPAALQKMLQRPAPPAP
jgi:hypothetical protein